jgi:uncharacterized protein YgiM (DUF1202 family)
MKKTAWLFLGVTLSTTLLAQQPSNLAPAAPAVTEVAAPLAAEPPAKATKTKAAKPAPKRPAIVEPSVTLAPGKAVVSGKSVNVRGQASMNSESVARLNAGDTVTVLEQITLDKFKPDEPRQWAKIAFPDNADVWVNASFIAHATMTVTPNKLNLRSGPGENYSVVGVIERGTQVKEVLTDGNWMRISAPSGAYAFIAAMYLQQEAPAVAAAPVTPEPAPAPVAEPEPAAAPPAGTMMTMPMPALQATESAVVAQPPPPRIVSHEGVVKRTGSIQSPTDFMLVDPHTGETVNYLYTTSTNLNLGLYRNLRVVVTGEEGLDARWANSPVITIRRIHVVE